MITDKQLDAIINDPEWDNSIRHHPEMYQLYISWGMWQSMEVNRMIKVLDMMLAWKSKYSFVEKTRIQKVKELALEKACSV